MESVTTKTYHHGANVLKFLLMPLVCISFYGLVGLPGVIGARISALCQFAAPAFFLLSGFFDAENEACRFGNEGKLILRTALRFFVLLAAYLMFNFYYYTTYYVWPLGKFVRTLLQKQSILNAVALCFWPFTGKNLWFIQSLLYLRVGLWLMRKLKLMRFYKVLMVFGFLAMLLKGEFARVVGTTYYPNGWLTCALPYMLFGRFVYEKREKLFSLPVSVWIIGFILGTMMSYGEFTALSNRGLLVGTEYSIGFFLMSLSVCCPFLARDIMKNTFFAAHGRTYSWRIYALSQPVAMSLLMLSFYLSYELYQTVFDYCGIIVYFACLALSFVYGFARFLTWDYTDSTIIRKWRRWLH